MKNTENLAGANNTENYMRSDSSIYNKEEKTRGFKICAAICAIILSIVTCICFGWYFNTESMYFVHSPIIYVFVAIICAISILVAAICIFSGKHLVPPTGKASKWINYFTALELLYLLIVCVIEKKYGIAAMTLFPIIYFIGVFAKSTVFRTLLGFCTSLWCAVIIVNTYFSYDIPVNSPFKLICQFGLAFSMLLIVSEIRFDLDAGSPKIYMLLACLSFCINLAAVCAQIALHVKGTHETSIYFVPACAMAIYSSKIFLARIYHHNVNRGDTSDINDQEPPVSNGSINTDTASEAPQKTEDQKGLNTDEIVN